MADTVGRYGPTLSQRGISDLTVDGRKVGGSSLYVPRRPSVFFYQASLLVDCDLGLMARYLRHPPREPAYRQGRVHQEFCTTLRAEGCVLEAPALAALLTERLPRLLT